MMPRQLWGQFEETSSKENESDKMVPVAAKRTKLEEMQDRLPSTTTKNVELKVKNPLVTQTIEVMKQTEMLQSLIDTYSNKSGTSNYLLNPCQMIPEVDFPPENAVDFINDDKFAKPIWFIPPIETQFARGVPQAYPQINPKICLAALRKAVCGQLRVCGFTDISESALVLFADAAQEFMRNFMQRIREVHANNPQLEIQNEVEVKSLEKAYYSLTNASLTQVHNYFKHQLVARNRSEIAEFNGVLQEYDKLMKESQSMQKEEFQEGDFLNILEMPASNEQNVGVLSAGMQDLPSTGSGSSQSGAGMLSMLEGQSHMTVQHAGIYKDAFRAKECTTIGQNNSSNINTYATESFLN
ncbi:PREDICTED: uncharacterized protein LOC108363286 isoform X1 [Rhagoletis zephyria]|uniref:uncharacterized protein LOC108363286 isoform X1 n=1 Tax=Rhagoletis zephyria TaxID=28612 RepID=UPI0008115DE2|nr:PREDICTED: uncharacterized protein LOC108363286 isoform X1 [Rhagoletis zephyria]